MKAQTANGKTKSKSPRALNGKKRVPRKSAIKKLVREMYGGEPYEYYPLGKYIVAAPGVCGGRPTFKYTRIDAKLVLEGLADGMTVEQIAHMYRRTHVSAEAIREAMRLAAHLLDESCSVKQLSA